MPLVGGGPALVLRLGLDRPLVLHTWGVAQTPWEESLTGQEVSVYEIDFHFLQTYIEALSRNIASQDFNVSETFEFPDKS